MVFNCFRIFLVYYFSQIQGVRPLKCRSECFKHLATLRAISFVGGDGAGRHIYQRGSLNGKRVQSNMGAKNHGVIMPDANKEYTINQLVGAAFGAAGQRCMALTTAIVVGDAKEWIPEVAARAEKLVVSAGWFGLPKCVCKAAFLHNRI